MAKDLFSAQAADYSRWRPGYPPELIGYVVSFAQERELAWDCATGNGQAAIMLAEHVRRVQATDLSAAQLKHARPHAAVTYSQSPAEHTPFAGNSFDLITVAQAYHWFDHRAFCAEARRVGKPGAIVAIWGYGMGRCADKSIDKAVMEFYANETGPYWDEARQYVETAYRSVYFDFEEIPVTKNFSIRMEWSIRHLEGYLHSWSATQQFIKLKGYNPVDGFIAQLKAHWKDETYPFTFPLFLRMGRV